MATQLTRVRIDCETAFVEPINDFISQDADKLVEYELAVTVNFPHATSDFIIRFIVGDGLAREIVTYEGETLVLLVETDDKSLVLMVDEDDPSKSYPECVHQLRSALSDILEAQDETSEMSNAQRLVYWKRHFATRLAPWGDLLGCFSSHDSLTAAALHQAMTIHIMQRYTADEFTTMLQRCPYLLTTDGRFTLSPLGASLVTKYVVEPYIAPPQHPIVAYLNFLLKNGWTTYDIAEQIFPKYLKKYGLQFTLSLVSNCTFSFPTNKSLAQTVERAVQEFQTHGSTERKPSQISKLIDWLTSGQSKVGLHFLEDYKYCDDKLIITFEYSDKRSPDEIMAEARAEVGAYIDNDFVLKLASVKYEYC